MRVQIVHHQNDILGVPVACLEHACDPQRLVPPHAPLAGLDMALTAKRLHLQEDLRNLVADEFVLDPGGLVRWSLARLALQCGFQPLFNAALLHALERPRGSPQCVLDARYGREGHATVT